MSVEREDILPEKYRPQTLDDCVGQDHIINDFNNFIKNKEIPDMLLVGEPGTGKTTMATILAKEVAGLGNVLIHDASVESKIDYMRGKIKDFAETYGKITQNLKIIILDEADSIKQDAQQALRRTIERFSKYCRFIIICNYQRKIIKPIQSRCAGAIYHYKKIPKNIIISRLNYIIEKESISIPRENGLLEKLVDTVDGDLRKCLVALDAVKKGGSLQNFIQKNYDTTFLQHCLKGEFTELRNFLDKNIGDGQELKQVLKNSLDLIISTQNKKFTQNLKANLISLIGECEFRLSMSANYYLEAFWLCAEIFKTINLIKSTD